MGGRLLGGRFSSVGFPVPVYGSAEEVVEDELVGVHAEHDDAVP